MRIETQFVMRDGTPTVPPTMKPTGLEDKLPAAIWRADGFSPSVVAGKRRREQLGTGDRNQRFFKIGPVVNTPCLKPST